jgi:phosphoglycolate phosphatase-like HAD superfamily hydrolase
MKRAWFFDIDGTLSDPSHRLHHIQKKPKDWRAFFAACDGDAPIPHMIDLAQMLPAPVVCLSGRSDECRQLTVEWLTKHGVLIHGLFMRKAGDYRDDSVVKVELLAEAREAGFEPIMIFEDRKRVVDVWRKLGIPCAQIADGDF